MSRLNPIIKTQSVSVSSLYETDYLRWIETTAIKLRTQDYSQVDWRNLIDEIEDMGRWERRSLESNLIVVLLHLLKWQFQPQQRSGSWEASLLEHRRRLRNAIADSPSLKPYLESILGESYSEAIKQVKAETGLPLDTFPTQCPYSPGELLEDQFLPGSVSGHD